MDGQVVGQSQARGQLQDDGRKAVHVVDPEPVITARGKRGDHVVPVMETPPGRPRPGRLQDQGRGIVRMQQVDVGGWPQQRLQVADVALDTPAQVVGDQQQTRMR